MGFFELVWVGLGWGGGFGLGSMYCMCQWGVVWA